MNIFDNIEKFDSNICFINENRKEILYKDVLKKSEVISKELKPRSLIFVLAQNQTELISNFVSFFRKGLVQMLIDSKISKNLLKELINTYMPNYIFLPKLRNKELQNYEVIYELSNHVLLKLNNDNYYSINRDLILLLSTSGSTASTS